MLTNDATQLIASPVSDTSHVYTHQEKQTRSIRIEICTERQREREKEREKWLKKDNEKDFDDKR
jgi:hypothetical protein